jgi:hypothetical protein
LGTVIPPGIGFVKISHWFWSYDTIIT